MKFKKPIFPLVIAIICSPGIVQAQQIMMEAGDVTIIKDKNGSIEVDTGNTQLRVPQESVRYETDDNYSINDSAVNSSNSSQIIHNSNCGTRNVQSTYQSNSTGSKQTVTQTNTSTNICQ